MIRNMIRVIFWDEKIEMLQPILDQEFHTNPVVIISSMRPHFYEGVVTLLLEFNNLSCQNNCQCLFSITHSYN